MATTTNTKESRAMSNSLDFGQRVRGLGEDEKELLGAALSAITSDRGSVTPAEDFVCSVLRLYLAKGAALRPDEALVGTLQEFGENLEHLQCGPKREEIDATRATMLDLLRELIGMEPRSLSGVYAAARALRVWRGTCTPAEQFVWEVVWGYAVDGAGLDRESLDQAWEEFGEAWEDTRQLVSQYAPIFRAKCAKTDEAAAATNLAIDPRAGCQRRRSKGV